MLRTQPIMTSTTAAPVLTDTQLLAWRRFLRAHSFITRRLDADLNAAHQLTLTDYEVLLHLNEAPDRKMRMSELADSVLLTRSGMTRLVQGLEETGLVERTTCSSDARGSFARLTEPGIEMLQAAAATHLDGVRELFAAPIPGDRIEDLAALLGALPGADEGGPASCS